MSIKKLVSCPMGQKEERKKIEQLRKKLGITLIQAAILFNRNTETLKNKIEPATKLLNAEKSAQRIKKGIEEQKEITIYSDYDADGFSAAVLGYQMLKSFGAKNVNIFTNQRKWGYGMSEKTVEKLLEKYPNTKLLITADHGCVAFEPVDILNSKGVEVIITDHHQPHPSGKVPNAVMVNPHQEQDTTTDKNICGATMLWKVLSLIETNTAKPGKIALTQLPLVAFATIADVMPITGQNKLIVKAGLEMMGKQNKSVWAYFKEVFSDFEKIEKIDTKVIGFSFAPSINSVSRLYGSIDPCIKAFLLENKEKQKKFVEKLKKINEERKSLAKDATNAAMVQVDIQKDFPAFVVVASEFPEGLTGLVAGRIKEAYNKPVFIFTKDEQNPELLKGSGRSINGINIKQALDKIAENNQGVIEAYGGHAQACGATIKRNRVASFHTALMELMPGPEDEVWLKKETIDCIVKPEDINRELFEELDSLGPYGHGFEEPVIGTKIRAENIKEVKYLGDEEQHVILKHDNFDIVSWYGAQKYKQAEKQEKVSMYGKLQNTAFGLKLVVLPENILAK